MSEIVWEDAIVGQGLFRELVEMVRWGGATSERSLQKSIGSSEIGHPCARRIAMSIMEVDKINDTPDPLPSIAGKAIHLWFLGGEGHRGVVNRWNEHLGYQRFITERKVNPRLGHGGTCDLYDTETKLVVDLKNPGWPSLRKYKQDDHPGVQYETQLQDYGLGYELAGHEVKGVCIFALPRGGELKDAWWWGSKYDPDIARRAHRRLDDITLLAVDLDVEHHPDRYKHIPATPQFCAWCPYHSEEPLPAHVPHCQGESSA